MEGEKPLVVGLTGQTGGGKTTVSAVFAQNGYAVINCDELSRKVTDSPEIAARLGELFGQDVLEPDGSLNRKALGNKAFSDPNELLKLNTILHPIIVKELEKEIAALAAKGKKRILLDAPTLFECGAHKLCQKTVAVVADEPLRKQRIIARDNLTEDEAVRRITAQHPESYYRSKASYLLRNNRSEEELARSAQPVINRLEQQKTSQIKSMLALTAGFVGCVLFIWGVFLGIFALQYPKKYEEPILRWSEKYQVAPSFVYAVVKTGSNFSASANPGGLAGLTEGQFLAAREILDEPDALYIDLLDPETSIRYAAALLGSLSREFDNSETALAAYCARPDQVRQWLNDPEISADGKVLDQIPDDTPREQLKAILGAELIYARLYGLRK